MVLSAFGADTLRRQRQDQATDKATSSSVAGVNEAEAALQAGLKADIDERMAQIQEAREQRQDFKFSANKLRQEEAAVHQTILSQDATDDAKAGAAQRLSLLQERIANQEHNANILGRAVDVNEAELKANAVLAAVDFGTGPNPLVPVKEVTVQTMKPGIPRLSSADQEANKRVNERLTTGGIGPQPGPGPQSTEFDGPSVESTTVHIPSATPGGTSQVAGEDTAQRLPGGQVQNFGTTSVIQGQRDLDLNTPRRILDDAQIQAEMAAEQERRITERGDVRTRVLESLRVSEDSSAAVARFGDNFVLNMVDEYTGQQGAAAMARDKEVYTRALDDRKMRRKEFKSHWDAAKIQNDIADDLRGHDLKVKEFGLKRDRQNSGASKARKQMPGSIVRQIDQNVSAIGRQASKSAGAGLSVAEGRKAVAGSKGSDNSLQRGQKVFESDTQKAIEDTPIGRKSRLIQNFETKFNTNYEFDVTNEALSLWRSGRFDDSQIAALADRNVINHYKRMEQNKSTPPDGPEAPVAVARERSLDKAVEAMPAKSPALFIQDSKKVPPKDFEAMVRSAESIKAEHMEGGRNEEEAGKLALQALRNYVNKYLLKQAAKPTPLKGRTNAQLDADDANFGDF